MQSAALIEAVNKGAQPYPVLQMEWKTRVLSIRSDRFVSSERVTDAGGVTGIVEPGGWEPIEYGSGVEGGELEAVQTRVGVIDTDRSLIQMLETYDPRGSLAALDWAAPGLVESDWEPLFRGVLEDFERDGTITRLLLKTDDTALRTIVPPGVFSRSEWPSAYEGTIFGTHLPLVTGIHDAFLLTARGMVPAVNVRYDKDIGYWWLASVGNLVDIRRVYFDGEPQDASAWSIRRGVWGANNATFIEIPEGSQPAEGVVVSFDCEGPDANGLAVGPSLTSPPLTLRMVLEEYTYRDPPLAAWRGDASIIDDTTWDTGAAFFAARSYDCGRRFGGSQSPQSAAELIESFQESFPWTRFWWTPLGKLAFGVIDPDDVDPDASKWVDLEKHHAGQEVPYIPGDKREVYTHLIQPYMWSSQDQKYMSAYEAHDVAALPIKLPLELPNPWTQARFANE